MEINPDYLSGAIYHDHIEVLGWTHMKACRRIYAIRCHVCAKDKELYGEGVFETSKESLTRGYKPCGCGSAYRPTEEQYKTLMLRKASELGVSFVGWAEEFKGTRTKCRMSCSDGEWFPTISNFLSKGTIKFNRGKARKDDELIIQKFFDTGVFDEGTKFSRVRLYNKWYWKVECPVCGESGVSQPQHLQRGCRPCKCGNYKQTLSYIHNVYDDNNLIAIKFGISRSKDLRLKTQKRETIYDVAVFGIWEYPEKHSCISAERVCLSELDCGILPRQEFGDGYTETTHSYNIDKIIEVYENHGGVRIQ